MKTSTLPETCANCQRTIGLLETPMVWQQRILCLECYGKLTGVGSRRTERAAPRKGLSTALRMLFLVLIGVVVVSMVIIAASDGWGPFRRYDRKPGLFSAIPPEGAKDQADNAVIAGGVIAGDRRRLASAKRELAYDSQGGDYSAQLRDLLAERKAAELLKLDEVKNKYRVLKENATDKFQIQSLNFDEWLALDSIVSNYPAEVTEAAGRIAVAAARVGQTLKVPDIKIVTIPPPNDH